MKVHTVLCVTEDESATQWLQANLGAIACTLITTQDSGQAIALLFLNRRVEAILLDQRSKEHPNLGLARLMKSFRGDVPILLMSSISIDPLPKCIDACLCVSDQLQAVVKALETVLTLRKAVA